jgi:hypothetical protein
MALCVLHSDNPFAYRSFLSLVLIYSLNRLIPSFLPSFFRIIESA